MIRLTKIRLKNFGPHEHFEADLDGNLVGFVGASGKGKSTILQGVELAFRGRISHEDRLSEFIRRGGEKPAKSAEVEQEFSVDGVPCKIWRKITSTSTDRELTVGSEKPITGDKAVQQRLVELLGLNREALNSAVFIKQGAFAHMFSEGEDRMNFYLKLLMLEHTALLADKIDNARKALSSSITDLGPAIDEANATMDSATANYVAIEEELAQCRSYKVEQQMLSRLGVAVSRLSRAHTALDPARSSFLSLLGDKGYEETLEELLRQKAKLESTRSAIDRHASELSVAKVKCEQAERDHKDKAALLADFEAADKYQEKNSHILNREIIDVTAAQRELSALTGRLAARAAYDQALQKLAVEEPELEAHRAELEALNNEEVSKKAKIQQLRDEYREAHGEVERLRKLLDSIRVSEGCSCEVCGSENFSKAYMEERLQKRSAEEEELRKAGVAASADLEQKVTTVKRSVEQKVQQLVVSVASNRRVQQENAPREDWPTAEADEEAKPKLQKVIDSGEAINQETREVAKTLHGLLTKVTGKLRPSTEDLEAAEKEVARLRTHISMLLLASATPEQVADLEKSAADVDQRLQDLRTKKDRLDAAESENAEATQAVETVMRAMATELNDNQESLFQEVRAIAPLTVADVDNLVAKYAEKQREHDQKSGALAAAKTSMQDASNRLTDLQLRAEQDKGRRKLVEKLQKLRASFLPNGAVGEYLRYKFCALSELVSDYLTSAGADFIVAPSENVPLSYDFLMTNRPDGAWLPQSRMSGGQRVRLTVATLLAVHDNILPNFGLLVLDEPTTHVHTEGVEMMAEMFREIGESGRLQLLICDHNPILTESFTKTIEV